VARIHDSSRPDPKSHLSVRGRCPTILVREPSESSILSSPRQAVRRHLPMIISCGTNANFSYSRELLLYIFAFPTTASSPVDAKYSTVRCIRRSRSLNISPVHLLSFNSSSIRTSPFSFHKYALLVTFTLSCMGRCLDVRKRSDTRYLSDRNSFYKRI
jgi:hypothetical protein